MNNEEYRIPAIEEPVIPEQLVNLFRDVIKLCKERGCTGVDLKIKPSWKGPYWGEVQCQWTMGRHGEISRTVVTTELRASIEV